MAELNIITQNMNGYNNDNFDFEDYKSSHKADIYCFQEKRSGKSSITVIEYGEKSGDNSEAKDMWDKYFPWSEFKSGYWNEMKTDFCGEEFIIINVHLSVTYSVQLRLVLFERIEQLKGKNIILLGDFNAAFEYQSQNFVKENHNFLTELCEKGFVELLGDGEDENSPHYTFETGKGEKKKLDHVFISDNVRKLAGFSFKLSYIDDVRTMLKTDHSGIKLTITKELWDLYDKDRRLTGRTMCVGETQPEGTYRLIVHICIFNDRGELLIQQRQSDKRHMPEKWDLSVGGKVQAGESSRQAAEREIAEELGLSFDLSETVPAFSYSYPQGFGDVFILYRNVELSELTLQPEEVRDARWATRAEVHEMLRNGEFIPFMTGFIDLLFDRAGYEGVLRLETEERFVKGW